MVVTDGETGDVGGQRVIHHNTRAHHPLSVICPRGFITSPQTSVTRTEGCVTYHMSFHSDDDLLTLITLISSSVVSARPFMVAIRLYFYNLTKVIFASSDKTILETIYLGIAPSRSY